MSRQMDVAFSAHSETCDAAFRVTVQNRDRIEVGMQQPTLNTLIPN